MRGRFAPAIACVLAACAPLGTRPGPTGVFLHVTVGDTPAPAAVVEVVPAPVPDGPIPSSAAHETNAYGDVLVALAPGRYVAFIFWASTTIEREVVVWPGRTTLAVAQLPAPAR